MKLISKNNFSIQEYKQINKILLLVNFIYLLGCFIFIKKTEYSSNLLVFIIFDIIISFLVYISMKNAQDTRNHFTYITAVYFVFSIMITIYLFFNLGRIVINLIK